MSEPATPSVHDAALAFAAAGCAVIPASADGSKAPLGKWQQWQQQRPALNDVDRWFVGGHPGIGLVCGAVSGGLTMVELEGRAVYDGMLGRAAQVAMAAGDADLWRRVTTGGYMERTPSGGVHILYRIGDAPAPGNQKLARRPGARPNSIDVLAETRGEGGFVVVAPSHGPTHPTGRPWVAMYGSPATIPTITLDEHTAICSILRSLDAMPAAELVHAVATPGGRIGAELAPGDDYNGRHTWADVLAPHGWRAVRTRGTIVDWCRPDKTHGISATTGYGEHDLLYPFTTSTVFDSERSYSKFAAYALLEHGGNFADAARQLRREGYGAPRPVFDFAPLMPYVPETPAGSTLPHTPQPGSDVQPQPANQAAEGVPPAGDDPMAGRRAAMEANEYEAIRARDLARRRYDAEIVARDFRPPLVRTLRDELALPDEPVQYRVDRVLPAGGNVILTAAYKTGKTTTIGHLARTLVDGGMFLDKFAVTPIEPGRTVALFNYELSESQYRRWLRDLGVENLDAITVVNLRGTTLPLTQPWAREHVADILTRHRVAVWVVDPFARAMTGSGDENKNSDVGEFVAILDEIKQRTGVDELVMPAHTGRADEAAGRARGATRLNDWADVQWLLTKDENGTRYFSANGRDVDVDEEMLTYDEDGRSYKMGGGDRRWNEKRSLESKVLELVTESPGINNRDLRAALGGKATAAGSAIDEAVARRVIRYETGARGAKFYYTGGLQAWTPQP